MGSGRANKVWEIVNEVQSSLNWPAGGQRPAVPCTVMHLSSHVESFRPGLRDLEQRKAFQSLAVWFHHMSRLVEKCQLVV